MTDESLILSEADEIAALLPWYVSGKITPADKARVDAYAKTHPEVLDHIALARDEADAVFTANQKIHVPHADLDRLMQGLAHSPAVRLSSMKASMLDRLGTWLDAFTPRQLAYAGLAAALLMAVQAGAIGSLMLEGVRPGYQTASGPTETKAMGSFVLMSFQPNVPHAGVTAFLASNGLSIVDGPKVGGIYRVRVSDDVLTDADMAARIKTLNARADVVGFISAAPSTP